MRAVTSSDAPAAIGPYSQAIEANSLVFCSGQIGLDAHGTMVGGGIASETRQCLANLTAVLEAAGCGLDRVAKCTVYLIDLADFAEMNAVYAEVFGGTKPARATVQVAALPKGARVEIDAIACLVRR